MRVVLASLVLALTACRTARIDHVILGASDLDTAIEQFRAATGVTAVRGGVHPGRGTENALVSLGGGTYLELLAPRKNRDAGDGFVKQLAALDRLTPVGWAVHADDAAAMRARLRARGFAVSEVQPGSREAPSGETLAWSAFGFTELTSDAAPFFIEWSASTKHPSTTSPGGCSLRSFEVTDPSADALTRAVHAAGLRMDVRRGATGMRLTLTCNGQPVVF
jgi:catechol 2,3-dioxygenase-like lactoylglutathione lyase family enzyme